MPQRQQPINGKTRRELVTVTMRHQDYVHLTGRHLPMDEQLSEALVNYLKLIRDDANLKEALNASPPDGYMTSIRCAVPKKLCDEIRALKGRFARHTSEAVRLYLR